MQTAADRTADQQEAEAFAHVRRLRHFYAHLLRYVLVNPILITINLVTAPHRLWCLWVLGGWGIGLVFHAARVFFPDWAFGPGWERRQVEKRLGRPL